MNLLLTSGAGGLLVGLWHFGSLRWLCTSLVQAPRRRWTMLAGLQALRLAVLIAAGVWAARHGAPALGAATAGLLVARAGWLAREHRAAKAAT